MALSRPVRTRLAKALHAYVRAVPARDLPRDLRRWQSFRPQAISPHVDEMVASLDDGGLRDRILEWLDEKPSLRTGDADLLRLAAERGDGWERKAEAQASDRPAAKPPNDAADKLRERLEREKARTTSAKEDLRRAKEDLRRMKEAVSRAQLADKKAISELTGKLREATRELEKTRSALKKLEASLARDRSAAQRERRREKRIVADALAARDELKNQVRDLRRDKTDLERRLRAAERRGSGAKTPKKKPVAPPKPARRKMLAVPKGLFEDAPETLTAWLSTPDVRVLIDGYNVTKAPSGFADLDLEAQRERLIDTAVRVARKHSVPMTIVFDGSEEPTGTKRRSRQGVKVEYSKPDEIADDHLIALLGSLPPDPVVVVTNDKELQHRARKKGATVAGSDQFLALRR